MSNYDESSIQVLEGTEGIRQRPAMYIGDVGVRGFHHLVFEVVDNSVDEAMANRCSMVDLEIFEDNSIKITDDGVGIPAGMHPKYGISTLEVIFTKLHSGGKFDKKAYSVSGGLHGIGLAAVCALSESFHVESYRDGKIYSQNYSKGKLLDESTTDVEGTQETGTSIRFKPDSSIFTETKFDFEKLSGRLKELAYLTEKFKISLVDNNIEEKVTVDGKETTQKKRVDFYFEGGIKKFVTDLVGTKELIIPDAPLFHTKTESEGVVVEIAFAYINSANEFDKGFVNNINTHEGGTHVSGFRAVLTRSINKFAQDFNLLDKPKSKKKTKEPDKPINLSGSDVREGIIAIISVKVPNPQFEGQTKTKLGNSEVERIVQQAVKDPLESYLNDNPTFGKAIVNKAMLARRIREASRKLTESMRKGSGRVSLPGKLVSSHGKDPMKRELFLVEGQSAGGTAVEGRNSEYQEILFLRGKVLNVEKARLDRAMENAEIQNMITAIGMGIMDDIDLEKCRYGKVILLTDADVDGAHIATLLLTFFYRYMKPLIESGRLYIARPPLFRVQFKGDAKKWIDSGRTGKEKPKDYIYLTYESDLNTLLDGLDEMDIDRKNLSINRFKGLGEMNASQLEETTMDVETRRIERININDVVDSEDWLTRLMGDDVFFRKKFIEEEVFEETELSSRGPFYDNAFNIGEDDNDDDLADNDDGIMDSASLDEYVPEQELLAAFEQYIAGAPKSGDINNE